MSKYLKYISLTILIILISYVIFLYINYLDNDNNNIEEQKETNEKIELFGREWFFDKILIYKNDELLNEILVNGNSYIFLENGYIDYCVSSNDECENSMYSYVDDKLTVTLDVLFPSGEYDVLIEDNYLKLSKNIEDNIVTYNFVTYLG